MMTFENWLETRQGKFFSDLSLDSEQSEKAKEAKQLALQRIFLVCRENQFDPIPGVMLGEYWKLKNKDGSMNLPT